MHAETKLVLYLLASFGFAAILGHSAITLRFRRWLGGTPGGLYQTGLNADGTPKYEPRPKVPGALGSFGDFLCELIECPMCLGWWTGVVSGFTVLSDGRIDSMLWLWAFVVGLFTSASNFILARLTHL